MRFHLATPPGESGVAMFELRGEDAATLLRTVFRPRIPGPLPPGSGAARLGTLLDEHGETLDEALLGHVPASGSWCALASWTLSIHGGRWGQERVARLLRERGAQEMSRQETLRDAVRSGALDATRAWAIELLPRTLTERAAACLLEASRGRLAAEIERIEAALAGRDGDLEDAHELDAVRSDLRGLLGRSRIGRRLLEPLRLLIAGAPNSGKSTLFNRWVGESRVAVSSQAGTTRDLAHEVIDLRGYPVEIIDAAGLREEPDDDVERAAIARVRAFEPDAVVLLVAPGEHETIHPTSLPRAPTLRVLGFADRPEAHRAPATRPFDAVISALTGDGLDTLEARIVERCIERDGGPVDGQPVAFCETLESGLARALAALESSPPSPELALEALHWCRWRSF